MGGASDTFGEGSSFGRMMDDSVSSRLLFLYLLVDIWN